MIISSPLGMKFRRPGMAGDVRGYGAFGADDAVSSWFQQINVGVGMLTDLANPQAAADRRAQQNQALATQTAGQIAQAQAALGVAQARVHLWEAAILAGGVVAFGLVLVKLAKAKKGSTTP